MVGLVSTVSCSVILNLTAISGKNMASFYFLMSNVISNSWNVRAKRPKVSARIKQDEWVTWKCHMLSCKKKEKKRALDWQTIPDLSIYDSLDVLEPSHNS